MYQDSVKRKGGCSETTVPPPLVNTNLEDLEDSLLTKFISIVTMAFWSQQVFLPVGWDLTLQVSPSFTIENCHDCSVVQDYSALRFTPSIVASAAVNLAIRIDRGLTNYDEKVWSGPQQQWVGYAEESLKECMEYLNSMITSPGDTELPSSQKQVFKCEVGQYCSTYFTTVSWWRTN